MVKRPLTSYRRRKYSAVLSIWITSEYNNKNAYEIPDTEAQTQTDTPSTLSSAQPLPTAITAVTAHTLSLLHFIKAEVSIAKPSVMYTDGRTDINHAAIHSNASPMNPAG